METLRHCLPPSVRRTLNELPESLDATYERVLEEIKKPNREHARRLLQCLVAAIRPLRVEELAEVLAVDFDDDEGMPKLKPNWRWEDEEQALLASCSSLIAIVKSDGLRIVQFSHFSVREFLTSARLATSSGDISRFHIDLEPAHTILAQACMSILLRSEDRIEEIRVGNSSPLARYAAEHWVAHAQDGKVYSDLRKAMEDLFDVDKPYFAAWVELYDIDTDAPEGSTFYWVTKRTKRGVPLYYAARCGFLDLVEHLVANDLEQVNATGGYYLTPLVAALAGGHFQTAKFLYDNGAHPNVRGHQKTTPLHSAAFYGELEMVQLLCKYKADVHSRRSEGKTALHYALEGSDVSKRRPDFAVSLSNIARVLLEHGADVNAPMDYDSTPLHVAALYGRVDAIRVLLEHGAGINERENDDTAPLHLAAQYGTVEAIRVLLEHGADVNVRSKDDTTPLHDAVRYASDEAVRMLLEHGADVYARKNDGTTPLHEAAKYGTVEAIRVLLDHGADVNARKNDDTTSLHVAAQNRRDEAIRVLLEHGADVSVRTKDDTTPLHVAVRYASVEAIRMLLEHGGDVNVRKGDDTTPLHVAAQYGRLEDTRVLLEHGANVRAEDGDGKTPFQVASDRTTLRDETMKLLSEHGGE